MFNPIPGIILIEEKNPSTNTIVTSTSKGQRIRLGTVMAIGLNPYTNEHGVEISCTAQVNDTVYFFSYGAEDSYDNFTANGKKYYTVKFEDLRIIVK